MAAKNADFVSGKRLNFSATFCGTFGIGEPCWSVKTNSVLTV